MLMGDKGKYLGIVMGLTFASLIMTQQPAIFWASCHAPTVYSGCRLARYLGDGFRVQFVDDIKPAGY